MSSTEQSRKRSPRDGTDGTRSVKVRKSNESSNPSAKTKEDGFLGLNSKLRSCLRSPLALPLIRLLHKDDENTDTGDGLTSDFEELNRDIESGHFDKAKKQAEDAFEKFMKAWNSANENDKSFADKNLIKELKKTLTCIHNNPNETTEGSQGITATTDSAKSLPTKVQAQMRLSGLNQSETQQGDCDILFWERGCQDESVALPICLLEIGKQTQYDWWQKIGQGHDYVAMMRNPNIKDGREPKVVKSYTFRYPMILSAITLAGKNGADVKGDFGTFLCIPVEDNDFRVVLLRQKRVSSLEIAKKEFGKIMQASFALKEWRQSEFMENIQFECLGPNCAKLGSRLLRAYDTRWRRTNRSPELYKTPQGEKKDEEKLPKVGFHSYPQDEEDDSKLEDEEMREVFCIGNSTDAIEFGSPYEEDDIPNSIKGMDYPWEKKGKLLVISVPFREGRDKADNAHKAEKVSHFLPVLNHLIHLHSHGRVHGDIRAFNIVFKNEKKGWLIDLDFGGVEGKAKYPKNFNFTKLDDGERIGKGQDSIHKCEDYYALWKVFHAVHAPVKSALATLDGNEKTAFILRVAEIDERIEKISSKDDDSVCENLVKDMKNFFSESKNDIDLGTSRKIGSLLDAHAGDDKANNDAKPGLNHNSPGRLPKTKSNATGSRFNETK